MSGYGRGGRGAALLQALEKQARKPGQDASLQGPPAPASLGRGALMQHLLAQQQAEAAATSEPMPAATQPPPTQTSATQPPPTQTSPVPSVPLGRGLGRGLLARPGASPADPVMCSPGGAAQIKPPMGRGLGLITQARSSPAPGASATTSPGAQPPTTNGTGPALCMGRGTVPSTATASSPNTMSGNGIAQSAAPTNGTTQGSEQPQSRIQRMLEKMELADAPLEKVLGTEGRKIPLIANFLAIQTRSKEGVYQYHVEFSPVIDSLMVRKRLVREMEGLPKPYEFDGATLFMPIRLPENRFSGTGTSREGVTYKIEVRMVRVVPFSAMTQFFNVLFNRIMSTLKMCPISRHYYSPGDTRPLPRHKMEVWPGYVTSVKEYDGGLMCLVDTTHKVLRTETVLDVMGDIYNRNKAPGAFQDAVTREIVGMSVLTRYNNRTWRVDDINWDLHPTSTFETRNGPISYIDYYKEHYGKVITDLQQPLLLHRPSKREQREARGRPLEVICLIPELCYMTGLTEKSRQDFNLMKDMATHTRISPAERQQRLEQFANNVNKHPEAREILSSWGLRLDPAAYRITGRHLPAEMISFGPNQSVSAGDKADWSHALKRTSIREPVRLDNWLVICTKRNESEVGNFVSHIEMAYRQLGVAITKPVFRAIPNDRTETYLAEMRRNMTEQTQLVMTIFPTARDDRYNAIKKFCYCETPVASQVINSRTISRRDKVASVAQKVAMQMNCKLGGGLWTVNIPSDHIMIVGIDTYHDMPRGKNSWGGFVASMNRGCTRWFSRVCRQLPGEELSNGLTVCMIEALRAYTKENNAPPKRIILFRDGVGDGDMATVRDHEVRQIAACFPKFGEGYQPKLSVVVVQKRVNTKLYAEQRNGVDNPPPGTVVDHSVTRRELADFYLVSQFVRQGTVTPTHYVVIHDDSGWKTDILQKLAYKMTHMYYNWPGTIRTPAPCQYAHKLAYMVGESLHKDPHPSLNDRLFFL